VQKNHPQPGFDPHTIQPIANVYLQNYNYSCVDGTINYLQSLKSKTSKSRCFVDFIYKV